MIVWPIKTGFDATATTGGPKDDRASFQPSVGSPIERPRVTGRTEVWSIKTCPYTVTELNTFEAWFDSDCAQGAASFVWTRPITGQFTLWRIMKAQPAYSIAPVTWSLYSLTFQAMKMAGTLDQSAYYLTPDGIIAEI